MVHSENTSNESIWKGVMRNLVLGRKDAKEFINNAKLRKFPVLVRTPYGCFYSVRRASLEHAPSMAAAKPFRTVFLARPRIIVNRGHFHFRK
jgi:hypothetical protein